jgi:hypothetical protein
MGNLRERSFEEIWHSTRAEEVRCAVKNCTRNCWMIGSVSQQMKKNVWIPAKWIMEQKLLKALS